MLARAFRETAAAGFHIGAEPLPVGLASLPRGSDQRVTASGRHLVSGLSGGEMPSDGRQRTELVEVTIRTGCPGL